MAGIFSFLFTIYIAIVILAFIKVLICCQVRQLVKANFWVNLAIFALLAFLTLIILIEFYLPQ
jgi:hypothetical protein